MRKPQPSAAVVVEDDQSTEQDRDIEQGGAEGVEARSPRFIVLFVVVLILGLAGSGAFLFIGISSASHEQREHFLRSATDLGIKIESAWEDYVNAASLVHNRCRSRDISRGEFRQLYQYLVAGGLDVQAVQFVPNITRGEREAAEAEAKAFYAEKYPHVNYRGIVGFEKLENNSTSLSVQHRSQQDSYFPVHYCEPVLTNEAAIDLDLFSSGSRKRTVSLCLNTGEPAFTDRLRLVQETEKVAYGFVLLHPGVNVTDSQDIWPRDLVSIVIRIPDLLRRSLENQGQNWAVYLYDKSDRSSDKPVFLGATRTASQKLASPGTESLPETPIEAARKHRHWYERDVAAANKVFTVVVVALDDTFDPNLSFVILGAVVFFAASVFIAVWVVTTARRIARFNALKAEADNEKAALILENARQIAQAERDLNDLIFHEVRNPVSAAMAACSFVKSSVHHELPFANEEAKRAVEEDVYVVETSLRFVNDFIKGLFDMHRTTNKQLKLELEPTNIFQDVLAPVEGMLYERNEKRRLIVDCAMDLFVLTDRLRLEQVVLNIARNSQKFVVEGFIRLTAAVVDGHVHLAVEDSGTGIPREQRGRLFNKYNERLDVLSQGTGIGLFLCKNLVELLGGEIWLDESYCSGVPGHPGSRFVINLKQSPCGPSQVGSYTDTPVDDVESGDASYTTVDTCTEGTQTQQLPDSLSVLFVDDDAILRKLFSRMVKKVAPNWTIREAANGESAIQLATEEKVDLIFMDQYMASQEKQLLGTETVAILRSKGVTCRICGLSANNMEMEFLEAGADVFSEKPFPCESRAMNRELLRILYKGGKNQQSHLALREVGSIGRKA